MNKICCFSGHSKISYTDDVYEKLINLIEKLIIKEHVSEFWVGNYGNFDHLCARAVRTLKQKHLLITLNLIIPYDTGMSKLKVFCQIAQSCTVRRFTRKIVFASLRQFLQKT